MITDRIGLHLISSIAIIYRLVLTGFIAYLSSTQALPQQGWCFHQCRYHRDKAQPQVADYLLAPVPLVSLQPLCFLGMLLPNQQLCAGPLRAVHENNTTRLLDPKFYLRLLHSSSLRCHTTLFLLLWGGALCDDTKNGCEEVYFHLELYVCFSFSNQKMLLFWKVSVCNFTFFLCL